MEDIIHLLPDTVANQIAAGEVVQRPSSVVKEMVENSIDAGATQIDIVIVDGGKTRIQIIDNGKGMSETDARLSFERHATSKIQTSTDLFNLQTLGFRGEALASIAAVAQIDLKTRRPIDELGTYIRMSGSKIESQQPVACPVGTNFSVMNLFYNVPARRKFLKTNQTETQNILTEFYKIALVSPETAFTLVNNGAEVHRLERTTVRQRILDIFGKKINADLLPIEGETSLVIISGYVATPDSSKRRGAHQYFFVNGRYMRHPYFHSAVMHAYERLIPPGENISYFIYLSVPPNTIDVNVHPTKTEIKFDNEREIWQVLAAIVKESLGRYNNVPTIEFDTQDRPSIPAIGTMTDNTSKTPVQPSVTYNPFVSSASSRHTKKNVQDWVELYDQMNTFDLQKHPSPHRRQSLVTNDEANVVEVLINGRQKKDTTHPSLWSDAETKNIESEQLAEAIKGQPHFQYKGRFIITPIPSGLLVVDQHRAHVAILYEEYMKNMREQKATSQGLLFPELIELNQKEKGTLTQILTHLTHIGFDVTHLGGGTYSINGMPAGTEGLSPSRLLHDLIYVTMENGTNLTEMANQTISLTLAQTAAIVYGQLLTEDEISQLLSSLFHLSTPLRTPDGKTVFTVIPHRKIEALF